MARGDVNFCGVRKAALCAVTGGAEQSVCAQKNVKKRTEEVFVTDVSAMGCVPNVCAHNNSI